MSKTSVDLAFDGSHAKITLSAENGVSVLATSVMQDLEAAVGKVAENSEIRTLVICAAGKVFVAGANIKEMADYGPEQARSYGMLGQRVFGAIESLPCITVAAINGAALGGGMELALSCDFRIAVKSAKLGLPETNLGLIPGWGGIGRLSALIGPARAKRMFLSGNAVTADEGLSMGMVDEIVDSPDELVARVGEFCSSFCRAAPQAIALAKRAVLDGDDLTAFSDCFSTENAREGMTAFIEKRPANWIGE